MKFIKLILLVNLFVVFVSSSASAQNIEYPNSLALRELLVNKDYEKLNDEITTYQKRYEENIINEIAFDLAFGAFNVPNPTYEALFEEWIKQSPTSFVPYLARAYYLKAMADRAPGTVRRGYQWFCPRLDSVGRFEKAGKIPGGC